MNKKEREIWLKEFVKISGLKEHTLYSLGKLGLRTGREFAEIVLNAIEEFSIIQLNKKVK